MSYTASGLVLHLDALFCIRTFVFVVGHVLDVMEATTLLRQMEALQVPLGLHFYRGFDI